MAQLSPKQLFINFSNNYCDDTIAWGRRRLSWGKGAAFDFEGFIQLLKSVPYSCLIDCAYAAAKTTDDKVRKKFGNFIRSGKGKLALPYKFLQILDPDAFKEIQQDQYASVAHAVRNAADISRACKLFWDSRSAADNSQLYTWEGRGAIEPIFHYAYNSLAKALMFIGPNYLLLSDAQKRYNSCDESNLSCIPRLFGADFDCICGPFSQCPPNKKQCKNADECDDKGCVAKGLCANEPIPDASTFLFNNNQTSIHAGYFVRKSYDGYANFISMGDFFGTQDDAILLKYAQENNGIDYSIAKYNDGLQFYVYGSSSDTDNKVKRAKHVTMASNADDVKDFLYNGYGIVLSTNVGFSDKRDSIGISHPDRLWYHTMAIIGYDDTRRIYPEGLFLVANSWGNWNYGGHPDWGPIPEGSFLVTESHLNCILQWPRVDKFKDCNKGYKRPCRELTLEDIRQQFNTPPYTIAGAIDTANDSFYLVNTDRNSNARWIRVDCAGKPVQYRSEKRCNQELQKELQESDNCGDNCFSMNSCNYIGCGTNQSPWGVAFAISFDEEFPYLRKDMRYQQFFLAEPYNGP